MIKILPLPAVHHLHKLKKNLCGVFKNKLQINVGSLEVIPPQSIIFIHNGKIHREDGPAVITQINSFFDIRFYKNGVRHREDGPSRIIYSTGIVDFENLLVIAKDQDVIKTEHYVDNILHNLKGPAYMDRIFDLYVKYAIDGEILSEAQFYHNPRVIREKNKDSLKKKLDNL